MVVVCIIGDTSCGIVSIFRDHIGHQGANSYLGGRHQIRLELLGGFDNNIGDKLRGLDTARPSLKMSQWLDIIIARENIQRRCSWEKLENTIVGKKRPENTSGLPLQINSVSKWLSFIRYVGIPRGV